MTSDQVTKKKRFRPFKFFRKLARGKKHHIESLPTVETAPSESYYVPPSPEKLFIKAAASVAVAHEQRDLIQAKHQLPPTGYSEKIDTDWGTVPTVLALNQGPFADPTDEGQTLEIFEDHVEEEMESLRATRQLSPISRIRTKEIGTNGQWEVEIGIVGETPNCHSAPVSEPTLASEPSQVSEPTLVSEPTPATEQAPESALQQIVKVTVMEQLIGSCVGPLPHTSSTLPSGRWLDSTTVPEVKMRTFAPPAIERAKSAAEDENIQASANASSMAPPMGSQMVHPTLIVKPGVAAEGESKCGSPAKSIPLTMQRSRTAPAVYGAETTGKSTSYSFGFFPKTNVQAEPNGVEVETPKTPSLIVGDLEKYEEIIVAVRAKSNLSLKSNSEKQTRSPSHKVPSADKTWLFSAKVPKTHDNEVEAPPKAQPITVAARRQLMVAPPPPSPVVPRRTVAAVPRTAPLTAENLYAASKLIYSMSEIDNSVNSKYDDDQDTTFDLDSEAGTSYTGASESGYTTEDTGSMFAPASECTETSSLYSRDIDVAERLMGGIATENEEDDYSQTDDDRSTVFLTDGEDEGVDEEEEDEEDDDDNSLLQNFGGELIEMASELQKGGSEVLMSWLDLR